MKLLRILGVFLVLALFSGCEVWISFWGAADEERSILVDVEYPYGSTGRVRARLYQRIGSSYTLVDSKTAGDSKTLVTAFEGLSGDTYKVMVWHDAVDDDTPDFDGIDAEPGFTTDPIELFLFSEYTVEANTSTEWQQDGSQFVTPP